MSFRETLRIHENSMNSLTNESFVTKNALEEMIKNSNENYIRVKPFIGCGKPAYEIYVDFKGENDIEESVDGITFVVHKEYEKICNGIEIKYDKDIYNKGFYIRSI